MIYNYRVAANKGFNTDKTALLQIKFGGKIKRYFHCISFCVAVLQVKYGLYRNNNNTNIIKENNYEHKQH